MAEPTPADPDVQLEELCRVLNHHEVSYLVFGSHVARLNGVPLETIDVDLVPARQRENLDRLAEALNLLRPRWRVEGIPEGMKIDGGLEARHFLGDSTAVGHGRCGGSVDLGCWLARQRPPLGSGGVEQATTTTSVSAATNALRSTLVS